MQFQSARPDVVRSISQRWLLTSWNGIRGPHSLPTWKNLPAETLDGMAETLMFCDVVQNGEGIRFLIRHIGARIAQSYGGDFRGCYLDEALPPAWRDNALTTYRKAIEARVPVYNAVDTRDRDGRLVHLERLLLPYSRDGVHADRVLSSIETISVEGRFEQDNLGRSPHVASNCALVATIDMD
jgi:hypothetical protein